MASAGTDSPTSFEPMRGSPARDLSLAPKPAYSGGFGIGTGSRGFHRRQHGAPGGMGVRSPRVWHGVSHTSLRLCTDQRSPVGGRKGASPRAEVCHMGYDWGGEEVHRQAGTPTTRRGWQEQPPNKEARMRQRIKQVALGKATQGYKNYLKAIPKEQRIPTVNLNTPSTSPRTIVSMSKRQFHGELKAWRKYLHQFDDIDAYLNEDGTLRDPASFPMASANTTFTEEDEEDEEEDTPPMHVSEGGGGKGRRKSRGSVGTSPLSLNSTPMGYECYNAYAPPDHYGQMDHYLPPTAVRPGNTSPVTAHPPSYVQEYWSHPSYHTHHHGTPPAGCALAYHSSGSSGIYDEFAAQHYDASDHFPTDPDLALDTDPSAGHPHDQDRYHEAAYLQDDVLHSGEALNTAHVEDDDDGADGLDEIPWVFPVTGEPKPEE